jgi:hypothetical protein
MKAKKENIKKLKARSAKALESKLSELEALQKKYQLVKMTDPNVHIPFLESKS